MEIKTLFDIYKEMITTNTEAKTILRNSAMINEYKKLDFGFFPLGSGILTDKSKIDEASIKTCDVMVLGNDFGTVSYLKNKCKNNRENNSRTIDNLQKIGLKIEKTFFKAISAIPSIFMGEDVFRMSSL